MKKFIAAMIIILIIGLVIAGIGAAIFFATDGAAFGKTIEYTDREYNSEKPFDTVNFNLAFAHKLVFTRGETYKVKYSDAEKFPITVETKDDGTVNISEGGGEFSRWWQKWLYKHKTTAIEITVPDGVVLSLKGTVDGVSDTILPNWEYENFDLKIRGASEMKGFGVVVSDVKLEISGAAKFELSGSFDSIKVKASGSSELDLSGNCGVLEAHASGSVELDCENFTCPIINVESSGSVSIELKGSGDELNVSSSGSTEISAEEFSLRKAVIDSSGSTDAKLRVSEKLVVKCSGSADVEYWGDPEVEKQTSGSASVRKRG